MNIRRLRLHLPLAAHGERKGIRTLCLRRARRRSPCSSAGGSTHILTEVKDAAPRDPDVRVQLAWPIERKSVYGVLERVFSQYIVRSSK